jgi:ferrous iron transport protein A
VERISTRTLSNLSKGQSGIVRSLDGGRIFRSRAANLGFTTGVMVTVVQNFGHGPMIVALRGTRVALGRDEATQVFIEGEDDSIVS